MGDPLDPGGWSAEPVDHDPFSVHDLSGQMGGPNRDFGYPALNPAANGFVAGNSPGENPAPSPPPSSVRIAGHLAATPSPNQVYTPKYLAAHPQGSISSYDPSLSES